MADETSGKSLTQAVTELGLQIPDVPLGLSSALMATQTPEDAEYERMLANLCQVTGQSRATVASYVARYTAQWVSKPEPTPRWHEVEYRIVLKVTSGERIDWSVDKPDVPMFR